MPTSRRRCRRRSSRCARRGGAWWRPPTPSAAGSSEICDETSEPRLGLIAELLGQAEVEREELRRELDGLREELRELARGIHPRALTEFGLAAALEELAERFPFTVEVDAVAERLPLAVATVAYFVCSEGLVNAAKHAGASRVRLETRRLDAGLLVEVADDGAGGAELAAWLRPARARRPGRGARRPAAAWTVHRAPAPGSAQRSLSRRSAVADEPIVAGAVG